MLSNHVIASQKRKLLTSGDTAEGNGREIATLLKNVLPIGASGHLYSILVLNAIHSSPTQTVFLTLIQFPPPG